jgi:FkbM family methyltransferase
MSLFKSLNYMVQSFVLRRPFLTATEKRFSLKFKCLPQDGVGRQIYKYGTYEDELTDYLLTHIEFAPDDIMLDIGANIGWYTSLFAKAFAEQCVCIHAFEPEPTNYRLLQHNVTSNQLDNITLVPKAVADSNGHLTLHLYKDSNRGRHSLLPIHDYASTQVATLRLDDYVKQQQLDIQKIKFIKIDVEGFEYSALCGATAILERVPALLMEYSPGLMRQCGLSPDLLLDLLTGYRFEPYRWVTDTFKPIVIDELRGWTVDGDNLLWRKQ